MPRGKKGTGKGRAAAAPKATVKTRSTPSGLVGRFYRNVRTIGQVVDEVAQGDAYLVQPFNNDGTVAGPLRLVSIEAMFDDGPGLGYEFYTDVGELLAAAKGTAFPARAEKLAPTPPPKAPEPKAPEQPKAETKTETKPVEKPADKPAAPPPTPAPTSDPERALTSLGALVGQHGIVAVRPVRGGRNECAMIAVEVNGDPSEAKEHVPPEAFGIQVQIVPMETKPANGAGDKKDEKKAELPY
jgi:hypothetical protein